MESFFVTLPSTASSHIYSNTQSHFRVQLPQPIELDGTYKVGLSEIHIPVLYDNIDETTDTFYVYTEEEEKVVQPEHFIQIPGFTFEGEGWVPQALVVQHVLTQIPKSLQESFIMDAPTAELEGDLRIHQGYGVEMSDELKDLLGIQRGDLTLRIQRITTLSGPHTITHPGEGLWMKIKTPSVPVVTQHKLSIPHGLYAKIFHVTRAMTDAIPKAYRSLIFFDEHRDGTITISCKQRMRLKFPSNNHGLGSLLGFTDRRGKLPFIAKGDYAVDLKRGVYGLYVYSDLVQPHVVGDTFAPLLRVIPIQDEDQVTASYVKIYTNPNYYPLMQNRFETIEIDIRSDFGKRLTFRNGKTVVILSFKKV